MKRKLVIPAVASIAVFGALLWVLLSSLSDSGSVETYVEDESPTSVSDSSSEEEPDLVIGRRSRKAAEDHASAEDDDALVAIPGARLHGTVTDLDGRPLAGARVFARADTNVFAVSDGERLELVRQRVLGKTPPPSSRSVVETRTNSDGEYAFAIAAIPPGRYEVFASADGFAPENESWRWVPDTARLDFQLGRGDWIRGVVLSPEGRPVAGAAVVASSDSDDRRGRGGFFGRGGTNVVDETRSARDGTFVLNVYAGEFRIDADAEGFATGTLRRQLSGSEGLEVVLAKGREIAGRVVDDAGKGLADVEVSVFASFGGFGGFGGRGGRGGGGGGMPSMVQRIVMTPAATARTDTSGAFRFAALSEGDYSVSAAKPAFVPAAVSVDLGGETETASVEVQLAKGRRLEGRVVDDAGAPVAGAFVLVGRGGEDSRGGFGGRDAGGRGFGRRGGRDEEEDPEEAAARAAERELARQREPVSIWRANEATETDRDGRFVVDSLEERVYDVSVQAEGFVPLRQSGVDLSANDARVVEFRLDPGLAISGRVVSAKDQKPIPNASVTLGQRDDQRVVRADESGAYFLGGLVPGDLGELQVRAEGFSLAILRDLELKSSPDVQELDVSLQPTARVTGRVVDSAGEPVARARVRAIPAETEAEAAAEADDQDRGARGGRGRGGRGRGEFDRWRRAVSTRSNADGRFELEQVHSAPAIEIRVEHSNFKELETEPFNLPAGEALEDVVLTLASGGRVLVAVVDPQGQPISGARVIGTRVEETQASEEEAGGRRGGFGGPQGFGGRGGRGGTRPTMRVTSADGVAVFGGIDEGSWQFSLTQNGYQPWRGSAEAEDEEESSLVAKLIPENVITGIVRDLGGNPLGGVNLRARRDLEDGQREESWARSNDDGTFRIGNLGDGPYALRAERRGYIREELEDVRVQSNVEMTLIELGQIAGVVVSADTGLPVTEFFVTATLQRGTTNEPGAASDPAPDAGRGPGGFGGPGGRGGPGGFGGPGGRPNGRRVEDPEGRFRLEELQPGDYVVEVLAAGYLAQSVRVQVRSGPPEEELAIRLPEGIALTGTVFGGRAQSPVPGADVWLVPMAAPPASEADAGGDEESRIEALRDRIRAIRENPDRGGRGGSGDSAKRAEEALALLAQVGKGGSAIRTGDDGSFRLDEVEPGRYGLLVHHTAFLPSLEEITIREDRAIRPRTVRLEQGEELSGRVSFSDRSPAGGTSLVLEDAWGNRKTFLTDAKGRYTASGLVAGTYRVRAQVPNATPAAWTNVSVDRGKNEHDVEVESAP